jgi:hypothetical protein
MNDEATAVEKAVDTMWEPISNGRYKTGIIYRHSGFHLSPPHPLYLRSQPGWEGRSFQIKYDHPQIAGDETWYFFDYTGMRLVDPPRRNHEEREQLYGAPTSIAANPL